MLFENTGHRNKCYNIQNLKLNLKTCKIDSILYGGDFDLDGVQNKLVELEEAVAKPEIWSDNDKMTSLLKEKSFLTERLTKLNLLEKANSELNEWLSFAALEEPLGDSQEVLHSLVEAMLTLDNLLIKAELTELLPGEEDKLGAILEIHPGAGGTEAQDWAMMLFRMYKRWGERENFKVEILDLLSGEEAGIKNVTLQITGDYAYGFLRREKGIHRLIRISPFDSSGRRHTSFASVDVYPDASKEIAVEIREDDLRIDTFRASGPGGQHVNKTSSAVRITHLPTGIVVQCQNEKSQKRNKDSALKVLRARLYDLELQKRESDKKADYQAKDAIAWGSQIRTYTLQPYRLVKDHRTNTEVGNVDAVLDGELDAFIKANLLDNHTFTR